MTERRDFGPIAGQMREALDKYSRDELADLLTHIVRLYVIESDQAVVQDAPAPSATFDHLRELSFSQLILHLQMNLDHPELAHLKVSGDRVWVERGNTELVLTGDVTPEAPGDFDSEEPPDADFINASGQRRGSSAPAAVRGPIYPEDQDFEPRPGTPGRRRPTAPVTPEAVAEEAARVPRPPVGLRPAAPAPARQDSPVWADDPRPARGANPNNPRQIDEGKEDDIKDVSDRFSMLELD